MRLKAFVEMLRQMSVQFSLSNIVKVLAHAGNGTSDSFLLYMENGEYWYVTDGRLLHEYELIKFPPPIPSLEQLGSLLPPATVTLQWYPEDLNDYVSRYGQSESLYLPSKDNENN